ncbi:MAG: hypothetical protein ACYCWB_05375 [Thiobacillus sp.]
MQLLDRSIIVFIMNGMLEGVEMNKLGLEKRAQILGLLVEGNSIRSITRLVGCSINTVKPNLFRVSEQRHAQPALQAHPVR